MRIVVCGIGNKERGDDAFGPYVVGCLREQKGLKKIDGGLYPENYLNKIVALAPDLVIFLDTITREEEQAIILMDDEIVRRSPVSVTTHSLSFGAMCEFMRASGVQHVLFLGVPALSYEQFSTETRELADRVISVLNNVDKTGDASIINIHEELSEQIR
jgi:hydrogenase maturation protease